MHCFLVNMILIRSHLSSPRQVVDAVQQTISVFIRRALEKAGYGYVPVVGLSAQGIEKTVDLALHLVY